MQACRGAHHTVTSAVEQLCRHIGHVHRRQTVTRAPWSHLQMNALEAPRVIASVCHGPAAFTSVKRPADGEWMVKGKEV
jgi:putative intracellular protease/amidase